MGSKSGAGIDDAGIRIGDQGGRFPGNCVRKTQKRDFRLIDPFLSFLGILAKGRIDLQQFNVFSRGQIIDDL